MVVDYKKHMGFQGQLMIEPKPHEPMKHQYDFDAATTLDFLRHHGLEKDFKLNIECNHATLAGHSCEHEVRIAALSNALGNVDANTGDPQLVSHMSKRRFVKSIIMSCFSYRDRVSG